MVRNWTFGLILAALAGPAGTGAVAGTIFEDRIAAMNPCSGLKTRVFGTTVSVDRLQAVRIDRVTLTLEGNTITADLAGALSCRTSDAALVPGSVGAAISLTARLAMPDCAVQGLQVGLSNIGGEYGPVLEALRAPAEAALGEGLRDPLVTACKALVQSLTP